MPDSQFKMPEGMKMGAPTIRVRNLDGALGFYQGILGLERIFSKNQPEGGSPAVGFGQRLNVTADSLLVLKHDAGARERPSNYTGLHHIAILVPDRRSLALAYSYFADEGVRFDGLSDHLLGESLYLRDPEGNQIEFYSDRPRSEWYNRDGTLKMGTKPLDLVGLLGELEAADVVQLGKDSTAGAFPNGARIGHIHLRVADLQRSTTFYHEKLGLDISANLSSIGAMFLSAGGYHHRVALNTWYSAGGRRHEVSELGLDSFKIELPSDQRGSDFIHHLKSRLRDNLVEGREEERGLTVFDPDGIPVTIVTTD
jgi:catechol 2,3-dioxygenase